MGRLVKFVVSFIYILFLSSDVVCVSVQSSVQNLPRVKRQDGYVYDRPNVSFDLPTRSTTVSTQAPTVDRTQEQQMYYAYPAPAGDTVNIGYSTTGSTTASPATSGAVSSTSGASEGGGYNYGSSLTTGSQGSSGSGAAGYNYNAPTSTTTTQTPTSTRTQSSVSDTISTSAPKYLPPVGGGSVGGGVSINIPTGGGGGSSVVSGTTTTTTPIVSNPIPVPDTNYLPPLPAPQPSPGPTPVPAGPSPPSSNYLPPNSGPVSPNRQGQVFTPASTYLPPVL